MRERLILRVKSGVVIIVDERVLETFDWSGVNGINTVGGGVISVGKLSWLPRMRR